MPQFVKDHYCRPLPGYAADAAPPPLPASSKPADSDSSEFIASLVAMQQSLAQLQTDAVKRDIDEKAAARKKARLKFRRRRRGQRVKPVENGIAEEEEDEGQRQQHGEQMEVDSDGTDSDCR